MIIATVKANKKQTGIVGSALADHWTDVLRDGETRSLYCAMPEAGTAIKGRYENGKVPTSESGSVHNNVALLHLQNSNFTYNWKMSLLYYVRISEKI